MFAPSKGEMSLFHSRATSSALICLHAVVSAVSSLVVTPGWANIKSGLLALTSEGHSSDASHLVDESRAGR